MHITKLSGLNLEESFISKTKYHPSPAAWEDQILYFLLLDRFSDGKEFGYSDINGHIVKEDKLHTTPLLKNKDKGNAKGICRKRWHDAGSKWVGGNLKGLKSKIGYLKRMGITAIWISPIFKQVSFEDSYHGYGIQNYLLVDPHFGTNEELKDLVKTAHENNIYVILDIILNHSGDIFEYIKDCTPWNGKTYEVKGFRNAEGKAVLPFVKMGDAGNSSAFGENDAVWPVEFQDPDVYTRKGSIINWDHYPEYLEGDFLNLKDIRLGEGILDNYAPSQALKYLCEVYKYWIAFADIDGYRVDTVKHMDKGATRFFTTSIHEFTKRIGKENFYLLGEITGGRNNAYETLEHTGIDAALGIDDIQIRMENVVKGRENPQNYFDLFRNPFQIGKDSHTWLKNKIVTMFNDHDQVCRGVNKARFCAEKDKSQLLLNAMAMNITTLGIPCFYYGTEQGLDGSGNSDIFIREAMFGGEFGAFKSWGYHVFDEDKYEFKEISKIIGIQQREVALRKGRQYLREISGNKVDFGYPTLMGNEMLSVVCWSRILDNIEILAAMNTDCDNDLSVWVTIDNSLNNEGDYFCCIYSTNPDEIKRKNLKAEKIDCDRMVVKLSVPAHGFALYKNRRDRIETVFYNEF